MKRGLALISAACLILGFQNCSQSNLQSGVGLGQDVSITAPKNLSTGEDTSGVTAKVTFVEVPNMSDSSSAAQKASGEITQYRLVVSLQSGTINLMDNRNEVLEKRCLSSSSLQEIKTILSGSSICAAAVSAGDVCAQVYSPGYASLYADDERINLGERRDSCGHGHKDLCGSVADVFQNYISHLRNHWAEMSCE
ncbi:hypothetical protein AZI86_08990 [Bdellovibrio bacteriovorus]|uniref:Uncharacterized protein n=1 Tax=Bdellovibrio bacteriovorus TaxID=959 RepID=A0A150WRX8_BDEBC|nr:hypothetical protein [Bdellovibrio bacteriovorus]KYG67136.1 hypothetical protein AZI86_08990 [Bdellovibrio bacteriovorus]